ncbi:MAG: glycosyltransferase family 4 protein [Anaerolineae bacterium]|nr:glycosyltransferase family 4 protein [Anaerolineae bacterium]
MKVIFFANTDWYLYNFRLELAQALRQAGYEVVLLSPDGEFRPKLEAAGFRWINMPLTRRGINFVSELKSLIDIFSVYREEKPDFVHQFTIKCVLYGSTAALFAKVPHVINSIEGLGYVFTATSKKANLLRWFVLNWYKLVLRKTRVIFLNEDDQAIFTNERLVNQKNQVLIQSSGVNVKRFSPPETNKKGTIPLIVMAGRMLADKGVMEFVGAARLLKQKGINARFALVGNVDPGNPAAISEDMLKKWQDETWIEWWGWRGQMEDVYREANVVCLPTYYREGLPKMLIEAGACGLPLVTTDIPGCREVVKNGVNGYLIPLRSEMALADALEKLINDPDLCRRMGIQSREIVLANFSSEVVSMKTLNLYQEMQNNG